MCKALKPKVEAYCSEKGIKMTTIDADERMEEILALNLRSIPAIVYLEDGKIVDFGSGFPFWNTFAK